MKKNTNKKDIVFRIFSVICIFLSVYVFALLRQLTGEPTTKMLADVLIIFLLVVLNTAVLVLHETIKQLRKQVGEFQFVKQLDKLEFSEQIKRGGLYHAF